MIDTTTQKPLKVMGTAPFLLLNLPYSQYPEVHQLFDRHGIRHWMLEQVISFNGGPEMAAI